MTITWDKPYKQKFIAIIKTEYSLWKFWRTPLGWNLHLGRITVSYDNFGKVKR